MRCYSCGAWIRTENEEDGWIWCRGCGYLAEVRDDNCLRTFGEWLDRACPEMGSGRRAYLMDAVGKVGIRKTVNGLVLRQSGGFELRNRIKAGLV